MVENEKHLVCPIIILCHCSVYFSKKCLTFVLCTLFFFHKFISSAVCFWVSSHFLFFIKPYIHHNLLLILDTSRILRSTVGFLFIFYFLAAFWGLFFVVRLDLVQWDFCSACCFCHCASSSGWPNRPKLSKSSFSVFFFFFLVFLPLGCVWVYRDIFVHRLLFLLSFFFLSFFFLLSSIIVRYQRRPIQR